MERCKLKKDSNPQSKSQPNTGQTHDVKRELERRKLKLPQKCVAKCEFKSPHCSGVVPRSLRGIVQQFGSVHVDGVRYARSGGDSFVFVQNEGVARIENLLRTRQFSGLIFFYNINYFAA